MKFQISDINSKINRRRLKYGSLATVLTVMFIAAIVLINIVATMLFDRFPITLDLTAGSIYSVSQETIDYISGIESPVKMTVMATEDEFRSISSYAEQCAELMKNYTQHNPLITLEFKDLLSSPDFVASYTQELENGDIIVELDNGEHNRVKIVSLTDIINVVSDYEGYLESYAQYYGEAYTHTMFATYGYIQSSNAEQAITSAIMAVTDANPITAAVLSYPGANESDVSGLVNLLDQNGYIITNIDIQASDISEDVDLVIIPAPKVDYTSAEIDKIETWLLNNDLLEKDLIYVASTEQPRTPNLDNLLYKYGLTVEYKIVHETSTSRYTNYDTYTYQNITAEKHLDDVTNRDLPVVVPDARAVTARYEDIDSVNACEILVSSASTAVLSNMFSQEPFDPETAEERGSYPTVALAKYKKINQDTHISSYTNIIVFGSDLMLNSLLMRSQSFNNGDFTISLINDITGKTDGITITPKSLTSGNFEITESQTRSLTLTFALIIPVIILAIGTFVWIRRRHK